MNEAKWIVRLGITGGLFGVLCCLGPIIPVLIGVGGTAAFLGMDAYKPVFITIGLLILAGASWLAIRKRNRCCKINNRLKDIQLIGLIFGTGFVFYAIMQYALLPFLAGIANDRLSPDSANSAIWSSSQTSVAELKIDGMTCAGCAVGIKEALIKTPWVLDAKVNWKTGNARVAYDQNKTSVDKILNAKTNDQYTLFLAPN